MTTIDYSLGFAQKHVRKYRAQDEIMAAHSEAMTCRDCEDYLELGIKAYKWLRQSDCTLREAALDEDFDVPEEIPDIIATLYRAWLEPCAHAEKWIKQLEGRGFRLKNLHEFRDACEYVQQQVRLIDAEEELEHAFQGDVFDEKFWQEAHTLRSTPRDA